MSMYSAKSKFTVEYAMAWARTNPGKKGVIFVGTKEAAERTRKELTEAGGGARPINVAVKLTG